MLANDLTEKQQIIAMVQSYFQSNVVSCDPIGSGGAGIVYKLTFADRLPPVCVKKYTSVGLGERQKADLEILANYSDIPLPKVYFVHNATEEIPLHFLCMEYIPGVSACQNKFYLKSAKKRKAMAAKAIDSLLKIHQVKNNKFGELEHPIYDTWNDYYKPKAFSILQQAEQDALRGRFSTAVVSVMQKAFDAYDQIFYEEVPSASLIHGDFYVANILVNPKTLEPVAFIDPFNSFWADVEYELFALNNVMGSCFKLYENYKSKAAVSQMCDIKCAFYALFAEVLWYQLYGSKSDAFIAGLTKKMQKQMNKIHK